MFGLQLWEEEHNKTYRLQIPWKALLSAKTPVCVPEEGSKPHQ